MSSVIFEAYARRAHYEIPAGEKRATAQTPVPGKSFIDDVLDSLKKAKASGNMNAERNHESHKVSGLGTYSIVDFVQNKHYNQNND